ncbi:hypothetical protein [Clostridium estertheticum]|nr:hypothetical protein [Clostridium estertheticum]
MAYHLKMLDENREPTKDEILKLPNFNKLLNFRTTKRLAFLLKMQAMYL